MAPKFHFCLFFSPLVLFLKEISLTHSVAAEILKMFFLNANIFRLATTGLCGNSFFDYVLFHHIIALMCMFECGNVSLFSVASTGHVGVFSEHVCALFRVFTSALENWKKWELSSAWPCWGWTDWPVSITITTCWIWRLTSSGHTRKWSGQWNKTWDKHQLYAHYCIKKQVSSSSWGLLLYEYNTLMRLWQTSESLCNPLHPPDTFSLGANTRQRDSCSRSPLERKPQVKTYICTELLWCLIEILRVG